tara:strand:+ start:150 stop:350 length:201 start_codon:yes stop_codon:yes gene_type:complete
MLEQTVVVEEVLCTDFHKKMLERSLRTRRLKRAKKLAEECGAIYKQYDEDLAELFDIMRESNKRGK